MFVFGVQKVFRYCSERIKKKYDKETVELIRLTESLLKFLQDFCDGNNA